MGETDDARLASLTASVRDLRDQVQATRKATVGVAAMAGRLDVRVQQLLALRDEEADLGVRLERLESVLDASRISAHIEAVVARAEIVQSPSPHAVIAPLLPPDVYQAVVDALPPPIFFTAAGRRRPAEGQAARVTSLELPMPPALAPIRSVITWRLLTGTVIEVVGPALAGLFRGILDQHIRSLRRGGEADLNVRRRVEVDLQVRPSATGPDDSVRLTASHGRLVLRRPGYEARARRGRPWHFLVTTVSLARESDTGDHGSLVRGAADGDGTARIPFRPNTALTVFDVAGAHAYESIPEPSPPGTERYSYEFPIGPDAGSRERLGFGV